MNFTIPHQGENWPTLLSLSPIIPTKRRCLNPIWCIPRRQPHSSKNLRKRRSMQTASQNITLCKNYPPHSLKHNINSGDLPSTPSTLPIPRNQFPRSPLTTTSLGLPETLKIISAPSSEADSESKKLPPTTILFQTLDILTLGRTQEPTMMDTTVSLWIWERLAEPTIPRTDCSSAKE